MRCRDTLETLRPNLRPYYLSVRANISSQCWPRILSNHLPCNTFTSIGSTPQVGTSGSIRNRYLFIHYRNFNAFNASRVLNSRIGQSRVEVTTSEKPSKNPLENIEVTNSNDTPDEDGNSKKQPKGAKFVLYTSLMIFLLIDLYYLADHLKAPKRNILLQKEFTLCDILKITKLTPTTKYYVIKCKNTCSGTFHVQIKDDSCQIGRSYTPVYYNENEIGILVRDVKDGVLTSMLNNLGKGDQLYIRGPFETIPEYTGKDLIMIAGGTGIYPFYQLIKQLNGKDVKMKLLYLNKNQQEILLKRELEILKSDNPNLEIKYYTNDGKIYPRFKKEDLAVTDSDVLVCGSDAFVEHMAGRKDGDEQGVYGGVLKELGFDSKRVWKL